MEPEEYPPYRVICPETGKQSWSLDNPRTGEQAPYNDVVMSYIYSSLGSFLCDEFAEDYDFLDDLFRISVWYVQQGRSLEEELLHRQLKKVAGWADERFSSKSEVDEFCSKYCQWRENFDFAYSRIQSCDEFNRYRKHKFERLHGRYFTRYWRGGSRGSPYEEFVEAKKERDKKRFSQGSVDGKK